MTFFTGPAELYSLAIYNYGPEDAPLSEGVVGRDSSLPSPSSSSSNPDVPGFVPDNSANQGELSPTMKTSRGACWLSHYFTSLLSISADLQFPRRRSLVGRSSTDGTRNYSQSNFSRILQLPRHTGQIPTPLCDTVISYDEAPLTQPPPLQGQLAAVQVQLEALVIDAVQGQDSEEDHAVETENMQSDHVEVFAYEDETQ
ncbi:hypothetical protein K457DRAFT_23914 [Linnemannia elongata AG-77]|uniref:Uncharacterized protein n=1 Tax=Linnemannia elongata AG-77 TaxID=1314771 RepID=A0A197JHQ8_9FUNG|nr:hypothetical protein K457DRAFT_23914 [Linnemannia elongata AG-77]